MATQFYVVPIMGSGTEADPRRPKYSDTDLSGVAWGAMDYGNEPFMLVATAANAALAAEVDVLSIPANINALLTAGQVTTVQTKLEAINIPANWLDTTYTWRKALRIVAGILQYAQRIQGMFNVRVFPSGVTLSTVFSTLTQGQQNALIQSAQSFGWDISSLSASSTVRQILNFAGAHWVNTPIPILDTVI